MVPTTEPERFGPTRNPWDPDRSTSGSSGGSAAAVASRMVPMAHADDLGGSIRYPAARVRSLRPQTDPRRGCRTGRSTATSPAAGPANSRSPAPCVTPPRSSTFSPDRRSAIRTSLPRPRARSPMDATTDPRRFASRTPHARHGGAGHADCVAALDDALALCTELGHEVVEAELPPFDEVTGGAIGTVFNAAHRVDRRVLGEGARPRAGTRRARTVHPHVLGARPRNPGPATTSSPSRSSSGWRAASPGSSTGTTCSSTPTMSEPPAPIGEITSTADDPARALERGGRTVGYSGVIANFTGNPAMSVPLWWNADGLPIGVHFLGRFGDEADAARSSRASSSGPTLVRPGSAVSRSPRRRIAARPTSDRRRDSDLLAWVPSTVPGDERAVGHSTAAKRSRATSPSSSACSTSRSSTATSSAASTRDGDERRPRLFGGQVAAQAARAASLTVPDDRSIHSLHGYFLRAGQADRPTILHVDRDRDGRSYSGRHVAARQDGEVIMSLLVSFHVDEDGPEYPVRRDPRGGSGARGRARAADRRRRTGRCSTCGSPGAASPAAPRVARRTSSGPAPAVRSPTTGSCTRACSPTSPTSAPASRSCRPPTRQWWGPSLDHAVWFHHPARMDDWVLVDLVPGAAAGARGFYTGTVHDRSGRLLATIAQEHVMRPHARRSGSGTSGIRACGTSRRRRGSARR